MYCNYLTFNSSQIVIIGQNQIRAFVKYVKSSTPLWTIIINSYYYFKVRIGLKNNKGKKFKTLEFGS
jgi:hypothetical protein